MLPPEFIDRFKQLMNISIEDLAHEAKGEFSKRSADFAKRGHTTPQNQQGVHHATALWHTQQRINKTLEALKKVLSVSNLSYSDNLASELKAMIEPL
ncbi:MAG: hypothetical protein OEY91_15120, partial [Nitrospirota bacterium]|nr:hypothetical protein [Nitrospirota bacterium]